MNYLLENENKIFSDFEFREKYCAKLNFRGFQAATYFFCADTDSGDEAHMLAMSYALDCAKRYIAEIEGEIEDTEDGGIATVNRLHARCMTEAEKCLVNPAPYRESADYFIKIAKIGCGDLFRMEQK